MGNMIEDAVIAPSLPNLAAIICLNCRNNESARIWFSEEDAWHHIDTTHGKFFRKKLLSAACRLCDQVGSMSAIRSHVLQCRLGINFDNTVSEEERNDYSHLINIQSQPENRSESDILPQSNPPAPEKSKSPTLQVKKETPDNEIEIVLEKLDVEMKKIKRRRSEEKEDGELDSSQTLDKSRSRGRSKNKSPSPGKKSKDRSHSARKSSSSPSPKSVSTKSKSQLNSKKKRRGRSTSSSTSSSSSSSDSSPNARPRGKRKRTSRREGTPRRDSSSSSRDRISKRSTTRKPSAKKSSKSPIRVSSSRSPGNNRFHRGKSGVRESSPAYRQECWMSPRRPSRPVSPWGHRRYSRSPRSYRRRSPSPRYRSRSRSRSRSPWAYRHPSPPPRRYSTRPRSRSRSLSPSWPTRAWSGGPGYRGTVHDNPSHDKAPPRNPLHDR